MERHKTDTETGREEDDQEWWGDEDDYDEEEQDWYGDDFVLPSSSGPSSGSRRTPASQLPSKKQRNRTEGRPPHGFADPSAAPVLEPRALEQAVRDWRARSRQSHGIDPEGCQQVLALVLAYLKQRYADHFPSASHSSAAQHAQVAKAKAHVALEKVELVFTVGGAEIQCQPGTGQIEFGLDAIKKEFYDGASSRYLLENDFMHKAPSP
jgi:hypothetical protein